MTTQITVFEARAEYRSILARVADAVGAIIGDKEIALKFITSYTIAVEENDTVCYVIRSFTNSKVVIRDFESGEENELGWMDIDLLIAIYILEKVANGEYHEYNPDED